MSTVRLPSQCVLGSVFRPQSFKNVPTFVGSVKSISKSFGLKSSNGFKASAMAVYKVKLIGPDGDEHEFEARDDTYILDAAEEAGVELPYSCRAQPVLVKWSRELLTSLMVPSLMKEGYLLTCISYPTCDRVIHTHKEGDSY